MRFKDEGVQPGQTYFDGRSFYRDLQPATRQTGGKTRQWACTVTDDRDDTRRPYLAVFSEDHFARPEMTLR